MSKLAELYQQQKMEAIRPKIKVGTPPKGNPVFTSEEFHGFTDFMSDNEQEDQLGQFKEFESMKEKFNLMKLLMKYLFV